MHIWISTPAFSSYWAGHVAHQASLNFKFRQLAEERTDAALELTKFYKQLTGMTDTEVPGTSTELSEKSMANVSSSILVAMDPTDRLVLRGYLRNPPTFAFITNACTRWWWILEKCKECGDSTFNMLLFLTSRLSLAMELATICMNHGASSLSSDCLGYVERQSKVNFILIDPLHNWEEPPQTARLILVNCLNRSLLRILWLNSCDVNWWWNR